MKTLNENISLLISEKGKRAPSGHATRHLRDVLKRVQFNAIAPSGFLSLQSRNS
jgi:hypothetical protein